MHHSVLRASSKVHDHKIACGGFTPAAACMPRNLFLNKKPNKTNSRFSNNNTNSVVLNMSLAHLRKQSKMNSNTKVPRNVIATAQSQKKGNVKQENKSKNKIQDKIWENQLKTATVIDEKTGLTLECVVHDTFEIKGKGTVCLLEPLDIPIQVLRGEGAPEEDMGDLSDAELDLIFADLAASLAKRRLKLYRTAFCLTVRGALRYFDGDVVILDEGEGDESEGVEITTFASKGAFYLAYTPVLPLLLAACPIPDLPAGGDGETRLKFDEEILEDERVQQKLLQLHLLLEAADQDEYEDEE